MEINPELKRRLKEKTTWLGIAGLLGVFFGLESNSYEQIAGLIVFIFSIIFPEQSK